MIQVSDLSVRYGAQPALDSLSLRIAAGEFVLVSGPSGCGKSTLALCLAGLIPQLVEAEMTGRVQVAGADTVDASVPALAHRVGLVFQNPATQLFHATVEEEVAFAPTNLDLPADQVRERVLWAMRATGITHLAGKSVRHLSAGEGQRVAIAAVLALRPQLLILDEPTANLDGKGVAQLAGVLDALHHEQGLTVIVIDHRLAPFVPLADRLLLMEAGRIVADGGPNLVTDKALLTRLGMRYPWLDDQRRLEPRSRAVSSPATPPRTVEPLVSLQRVTAAYGKRTVFQDLNLDLYPGQFIALVGDNGAGKSTVARLLAGMMRPKRGRITWHPSLRRLLPGRRVGLLLQNPLHQLVCDTVGQEVSFGPRNLGTNGDLRPLLEAADLVGLEDRSPQNLSVGQQQRTALAATLALRPQLLILDEPIMGQDWAHLSRLMEALTELYRGGQTILLITHDDRLVSRYAGEVVRLADGAIASSYPIDGEKLRADRPDRLLTTAGISTTISKGPQT